MPISDWLKFFPYEEFLKTHGPLALSLFLVLIISNLIYNKAILAMADKRVKEITEAKDKEIERLCSEKKYLQEKLLEHPLPSSRLGHPSQEQTGVES